MRVVGVRCAYTPALPCFRFALLNPAGKLACQHAGWRLAIRPVPLPAQQTPGRVARIDGHLPAIGFFDRRPQCCLHANMPGRQAGGMFA